MEKIGERLQFGWMLKILDPPSKHTPPPLHGKAKHNSYSLVAGKSIPIAECVRILITIKAEYQSSRARDCCIDRCTVLEMPDTTLTW